MNLSGNAVRYWVNCIALPLENLIVVCDDLNLHFGTIRMRKSGSDGGNNGLKNIEECLVTTEYSSIRIGIGADFKHGEQVDFVLGALSEEEQFQMPQICSKITEGIRNFTTIGPDRAMNLLNTHAKNV